MDNLSETEYNKMTKQQKVRWHNEQLKKLADKNYEDETDCEEECFGNFQEIDSEICNICEMREECMSEMPSKFDQALKTMGVDVE